MNNDKEQREKIPKDAGEVSVENMLLVERGLREMTLLKVHLTSLSLKKILKSVTKLLQMHVWYGNKIISASYAFLQSHVIYLHVNMCMR